LEGPFVGLVAGWAVEVGGGHVGPRSGGSWHG
jgi:hypothetical protein